MVIDTQRSISTLSNPKYVNRELFYMQKQRRNDFLLCSRVLRLLIPFLGFILLFRFMYQGESASISFTNIWTSLSNFKVGSDALMRSMELISKLDLSFDLPSVSSLSDLFDWLGDFGDLFVDTFKGLFGVLSLPVSLILCAFDIVSFCFSLLFGA